MTEYQIETVADFLKVPTDRRAKCLEEFAEWIELAEALTDFTAACNLETEPVRFDWIDDGKRKKTVIFDASPQADREGGSE